MDLCFIDTETTSLHPTSGRVWEFAGIRRSGDGTEKILDFQIEQPLDEADPFSLKIGKYRERFGAKGEWQPYDLLLDGQTVSDAYDQNPDGKVVSPYDAARLIERFTRGASIIGNVISFDAERLGTLLRSEGEVPGWHYHIIDIEPLIVGYALAWGNPFPLPYSSTDLTNWLGAEEPTDAERHTALGDARWVMRMWDALHGEEPPAGAKSQYAPRDLAALTDS
jgi:hypothetical protein